MIDIQICIEMYLLLSRRWQMRLLLQFSFYSNLSVSLSSFAILRCTAATSLQALSPISFSTRQRTLLSSYSKFCCRLSTMFYTISLSISKNLRHSIWPILLFPSRQCSLYLMRLLKTEMRSAGLGSGLDDALLEGILDALTLCFSFERLLPLSKRYTFCRVVLLVLRECLPESVRDRSRVWAVLLRYGPKGSGECSLSQRQLLRLYLFIFLTKSSKLRSCNFAVYFLLAWRCIQRLLHTRTHQPNILFWGTAKSEKNNDFELLLRKCQCGKIELWSCCCGCIIIDTQLQEKSMSQTDYIYRKNTYLQDLKKEHLSFLAKGLSSYLTIPNNNNYLYYPALLMSRSESRMIASLNHKQNKSSKQYLFLVVALKLAGRDFHAELSEYKRIFPGENHSQQIQKYVDYFNKIPAFVVASHNKQKIRWQFQKLLGKASKEGYYSIPQVPVFLVSTKWLEQLYSTTLDTPSPVSNETLVEQVPFPLADPNYMHYNYRVREDLRENEDYKLVSFQAWQLLLKTYGGFQVRRMTTREKSPIVEVWLVTASILIVEDRCVFHRIDLQVSKGDTFNQLIERVKAALNKYKIVPQRYLSRVMTLFKSKELSQKEVIAIMHDDSRPHIINPNFQKISEWNLQVQQAGILTPHDFLILNFSQQRGIFSKVPPLKVITVREKCLHCGSAQDLTACKCRSVLFCSPKCREAQKDHKKQCDTLQAESRKFNLVVQHFEVRKRSFPELKNLHLVGKVGLQNLGNTCYMNSALQCLVRLTDLAEYFLRNHHLKDLNVTNVLGSDGHMACAFGQFAKNFYTANKRRLEPTDILRILQRNAQFRGHNHQDSQEFLNYFLDKLHEDLNKVKVKPLTEQVESNGRPDEEVSRISWQNYKKRNNSFISDLFAGQYRSKITCPDCSRVSITFDPFLSVTLQFPRPEKGEILDGILMSDEGQFQKMKVEVKPSAPAYQFYKKYFRSGVVGASVKDKKILDVWDPTKSIFQNRKSGLLFFYEKPDNQPIQIIIEFYAAGKDALEHFPRITFARELLSEKDMLKVIFLAIRNPIQKALLKKDLTEEEYLSICFQRQFLRIKSMEQDEENVVFPLTTPKHLKVRAEIINERLQAAPKMNVTMGTYQGLTQSLVRGVKDELSMRELIQCFSQPQQLTEQNTWYCSACKDHKLADKTMNLYSLPQYLIIHLKRFNHRGNRYVIYGEKVNTAITLEEFEEMNGKRYELLGVVNHFGSLVHGHYTACVKRDEWFNYNDSQCTRTRLDGKNAYLLFYKRVQP